MAEIRPPRPTSMTRWGNWSGTRPAVEKARSEIPPELEGTDRLIWVLFEIRKERPLTALERAQVAEIRAMAAAERDRCDGIITSLDALTEDRPLPVPQ